MASSFPYMEPNSLALEGRVPTAETPKKEFAAVPGMRFQFGVHEPGQFWTFTRFADELAWGVNNDESGESSVPPEYVTKAYLISEPTSASATDAQSVACYYCGASSGAPCIGRSGDEPHAYRVSMAREVARMAASSLKTTPAPKATETKWCCCICQKLHAESAMVLLLAPSLGLRKEADWVCKIPCAGKANGDAVEYCAECWLSEKPQHPVSSPCSLPQTETSEPCDCEEAVAQRERAERAEANLGETLKKLGEALKNTCGECQRRAERAEARAKTWKACAKKMWSKATEFRAGIDKWGRAWDWARDGFRDLRAHLAAAEAHADAAGNEALFTLRKAVYKLMEEHGYHERAYGELTGPSPSLETFVSGNKYAAGMPNVHHGDVIRVVTALLAKIEATPTPVMGPATVGLNAATGGLLGKLLSPKELQEIREAIQGILQACWDGDYDLSWNENIRHTEKLKEFDLWPHDDPRTGTTCNTKEAKEG